ncbi:MAG: hypothetical protein ACRC6T_11035 [Sarcina sp.]
MHLKHRKIKDINIETQVIRVAYVEEDDKVTGICSIIIGWNEHEVPISLDGTVTFSVLGIHKTLTLKEIAQRIEEKEDIPVVMSNLEVFKN